MGDDGIGALKQAIRDHFGSQVALARVLGLTPQAVSDVLRRGKRVPAGWCLKLERATGGKLPSHRLRPDLYPQDKEKR